MKRTKKKMKRVKPKTAGSKGPWGGYVIAPENCPATRFVTNDKGEKLVDTGICYQRCGIEGSLKKDSFCREHVTQVMEIAKRRKEALKRDRGGIDEPY